MKKIAAITFALMCLVPVRADAATPTQLTPGPDMIVTCQGRDIRLGDVQGPRLPGQVLYPTCPPIRG